MHRDLKWGNVLKDYDGVIKITDFDTLKEDDVQWRLNEKKNQASQTSRIGTPGFLSPEVYLGKNYSLKCDVFAFGIMIYSLLWEVNVPYITQFSCSSCGSLISDVFAANRLDDHVANCNLRPLLDPKQVMKFPEYLIDLMIQCWDKSPFNRPSFDEIVYRIEIGKKSKNLAMVILRFSLSSDSGDEKRRKIPDQKMCLIKPYSRKQIIDFVENKFKGKTVQTKVLSLVHSVIGSILEDADVERICEKMINDENRIVISVMIDQIDKDILKEIESSEEEEEERGHGKNEYEEARKVLLEKVEEILGTKDCHPKEKILELKQFLLRGRQDEKKDEHDEEETEGENVFADW